MNYELIEDDLYKKRTKELVEYYIKKVFVYTLVLLEVKGLQKTYDRVGEIFEKAKKEGFFKKAMGSDEEDYLVWVEILRTYLDALGTSYNVIRPADIVTTDLVSVIEASLYSITDKLLFSRAPSNEAEVHARVEGVLKCVFPDLKHKPQLTKPIKNFEPDTGLPSVRTLIEYKFISTEDDAKIVSDQILADTRGYTSKDWENFLFVIYETHRIKPESKWNEHLRECGVDNNTKVIVLSGEPSKKVKKKKGK
jgi:hypothetical protein